MTKWKRMIFWLTGIILLILVIILCSTYKISFEPKTKRQFDLKSGNAVERFLALNEIARLGPQPRVIDALVKALSDEDRTVRAGAASLLGSFGPAGRPGFDNLAKLMSDPDWAVRSATIMAINQIGAPSEIVPILVMALDDSSYSIRLDAATILGKLGADAEPALTKLKILASNDPFESVRAAAQITVNKVTEALSYGQ